MKKALIPVYLLLILILPSIISGLPFLIATTTTIMIMYLGFLPLRYAFCFVLIADLLSIPHQKAIIPGKLKKSMDDPVYAHRRLYGICWTAVYYFKPIYWLFLSVPELKFFLFRLFGYKDYMDFTIYPDTWIRDLPLLDFGKNSYMSNSATIGINIVSDDGFIKVDRIKIGKNSLIGHPALIALDSKLGDNCEVGVSTRIGIKVTINNGTVLGPASIINHGATIQENSKIGTACNIGTLSRVDKNIKYKITPYSKQDRGLIHRMMRTDYQYT